MLALVLSLCLGQSFGPPRAVGRVSTTPVAVRMAPLGAAVEAFDGGFLVAWADDRRLTNLARTPVAAGSDVWLKVVDRGFFASLRRPSHLVCPRSGLAGGPRLAPSTNGVVGLAWSDDRGVSLVRVGPTGLLDVPCGQAVSASRSSVVEVSPRGADFSVVFNGPGGLVRAAVARGAVAVPVTLSFLPQSSVATVSSEMNGTVVGWLQASDVTVDNDGVNSVTVSGRAISGFDLIEGTSGPAIAYVGDGGLFVGSSPTTADLKSSASTRRPYGARTVDGGLVVVSATANTAQTQLFSTAGTASLGINNPPGRPEGVAMAPDDEGLALITTETGVLTAAGVVRRAQGYDFQGAAVVSVADVLQRRPTVAWSEASGAWELVWEEATTATTFVPRHGFLRPDDPSSLEVAASDLIVDGGTWPRVFQQFDGGLAYLTLDRQVTTFSVPRGAVTAPVDQLDASITWVAPGPAGGFVWADAPGLHQEFVLRQGALPIDDFLPGEVTCATWFADRYVVTRRGDGGATLASFADDQLPAAGSPMPGSRACVAARPLGAPTELGLALVDSQGLLVQTVDGGQWRVPLDAGVRDLQMTSVAGRWLVVWDSEQGLMAGLFSDSEPQVVLTVDERPSTHRGAPSVASSPLGAAVVTWPVLQGDSVGLRVGVIRVSDGGVPSADGGAVLDAGAMADGGSSDGGLLPGDGGLTVDAGQPDGGEAVAVFVPVCGCSGGGATLVWLLVLAPVVRRGRRRG